MMLCIRKSMRCRFARRSGSVCRPGRCPVIELRTGPESPVLAGSAPWPVREPTLSWPAQRTGRGSTSCRYCQLEESSLLTPRALPVCCGPVNASEEQGLPIGCFHTTHWTEVLVAGAESSPEAGEALARLCQTYWLPIYAFIRKRGHGPHQAQDLTQEVFAGFLEIRHFAQAVRDRGRFRSFLMTSVENFL